MLDLREKVRRGEPLAAVTAYDVAFAKLFDRAGVDLILVGDSLAMTVLGHPDTLAVGLDAMVHHAAAVSRGVRRAFVAVDLPFGTYQTGPEEAFRNSERLLREARVQAVKLEWCAKAPEVTRFLVENGVPVLGHLGFTPQRIHTLGGARRQGKTQAEVKQLLKQAKALEDAGAFALVLELLPAAAAARIRKAVSLPTIGIGAGPYCDGQIQVMHDLLGLNPDFQPRHSKRYLDLAGEITNAMKRYVTEVKQRAFVPNGGWEGKKK